MILYQKYHAFVSILIYEQSPHFLDLYYFILE